MLVDTEFVRDEEEGEDLRTRYNRKSVELLKRLFTIECYIPRYGWDLNPSFH